MLGISYENLVKDFELTSLYKDARWRSKIINNNGQYSFSSTGVMQDDSGNLVAFGKMHSHIMDEYGTGDGKLVSAVENYLVSVVGLSKADIELIRSILIEDYATNCD